MIKKILAIGTFVFLCSLFPMIIANAYNLEELDIYLKQQEFYDVIKAQNAPTSLNDAGAESISGSEGTLAYTATDLVLPGKGGHDLAVTRRFNTNENIDENGRKNILSVSCIMASSNTQSSYKYAYRYYINGDTNSTPVYIVYDSDEEMLRKENWQNEVRVASNYTDNMKGLAPIYNNGNPTFMAEVYENENTIGFSNTSGFYWSKELPAGNDIVLERDLENNCAVISVWDLQSYLLTDKLSGLYDGNLHIAWSLDLPQLNCSVKNIFSDSDGNYVYYERIYSTDFYDNEMGKYVNFELRYDFKMGYDGRRIKLGGPDIADAFTYDDPRYPKRITQSTMYTAKLDSYDLYEDTYAITVTRYDGKKFSFSNQRSWSVAELTSVKDRWNNIIYYGFTEAEDRLITDTLGRKVVVNAKGITVNGNKLVTYSWERINNYDVDRHRYTDADDKVVFKVEKNTGDGMKTTVYNMRAKYDTSIIGTGVGRPFDRTVCDRGMIITDIVLDTGGKISYDYDVRSTGMLRRTDSYRQEYHKVSARKELHSDDTVASQVNYQYNDSNVQAQVVATTYPNRTGYKYEETYDDKGYMVKSVASNTDADSRYWVQKDLTYKFTNEGNFIPEKVITTTGNGSTPGTGSSYQVTEEYAYEDQSQRITQLTRDGDLIEYWSYRGKDIAEHFQKASADRWIGFYTKKETSSGYTTETITAAERASHNGLSVDKEITKYTYDLAGDMKASTDKGVTTNYILSYSSGSNPDLNGLSLTITASIPAVNNITDNNGNAYGSAQILTSTQTYDILGRQVSVTDPSGILTTYAYDLLGRNTSVAYADGKTATAQYDDTANEIVVKDESGVKQKLTYDSLGKNTAAYYLIDGAYKKVYDNLYDPAGRPASKQVYNDDGSEKSRIAYTYYADNQIASETVYEGASILTKKTYAYSPYSSANTSAATVNMYYDQDAYFTVNKYADQYGYMKRGDIVYQSGPSWVTESQTYTTDLLGNITSYKDFNAVSKAQAANTASYAYDYANRLISTTTPAGSTATIYSSGRVIAERDAKGNLTSYSYNAAGQIIKLTDSLSEIYSYYDKAGNLSREETKQTSSTNKVVRYSHDNRGRLTAMTANPGDGDVVTKYIYDNNGRLSQTALGLNAVTQAVNPSVHEVTSYTYDQLGQLFSTTDAMNQTAYYSSNILGELTSETDRNGIVKTYTYDGLSRVKNITAQGGGAAPESITYTYNYLGGVKEMIDNAGTTTYTYNGRGKLIRENRGGVSKQYSYDPNGQRKTFTLTESGTSTLQQTAYEYDTANRLYQVISGHTTTYGYDANSSLTSEKTVDQSGKLVKQVTYTYNTANLLSTQSDNLGGDYSISYYPDKNIRSITENGKTKNYTYDLMGRLTAESYAEGGEASYSYDRFGNRSSMQQKDSQGRTAKMSDYTYDLNNRLISQTESTLGGAETTTQYRYDPNGNQLQKVYSTLKQSGIGGGGPEINNAGAYIDSFKYDVLGRMIGFTGDNGGTQAVYAYDGTGLRTSKTVNGATTSFVYDGMNIVMENAGGSRTQYIRGVNLISQRSASGESYLLYNTHGDVVKEIGGNGTAVYDAFGNVRSGKLNSPFGYAGEYTDAESGLIYLRARYYDPAMGRFVSEDPVKDGTNWYAYCGNNPVNFVDPSGMAEVWIRDWVQSRGGWVTPNQYGFWPIYWGLKSITVSLPGQKPVTYTSADYTIKNNLAYIDDSILNRDFRTDGVYAALISAYSERGTTGQASRTWMRGLKPNEFGENDNWCITFVSWALNQAGVSSPNAYNCEVAIDWYSGKGNFHKNGSYSPRVGDTFFIGYERDNGTISSSHAGMVIAYDPPWVYTIEGCSNGKVQVCKRHEDTIYGYGSNGGSGAGYVPQDYDVQKGGY